MIRWITRIVIVLALGATVLAASAWYRDRGDKPAGFRTATVKRTDIASTISATGTLEPEEVIDIGAQVAGQIIGFGKDVNGKVIDYGSPVTEDMVLANIDDSLYKADLASADAAVASANAGVLRAQADLEQMKAKLVQAQNDWERAQKLGPSEALAQTAYDNYRATYETAKANVAVAEAAIQQAKGAVASAEAAQLRAQRNLGYCVIKSPVNGVIIDRRVNTGQTVVSSLNAPSLFLIAKDLKRMQVWVPVNEADIGHVYPGQDVTFTVDAFSGQTFKGKVTKVRLNAVMTQNVVTYTVEITTDNASGKLLPYLTANVSFDTGHKENVLAVPNAALRWSPRPDQVAPESASEAGAGGGAETTSRPAWASRRGGEAGPTTGPSTRRSRGGGGGSGGGDETRGTVWVVDGNFVKPVHVRLGLSDGAMTEIVSNNLPEGSEVVVGEQFAQDAGAPAGGANPFAPRFPGRGGGRRGG